MNANYVSICTWVEKPNGKGEKYIPLCLGKSCKGVNIYKVAKRYHKTIIEIFKTCPFCNNAVKIKFLKGDKND